MICALPLASGAELPFYWHLPVLIVVISLVYSATRFDDWTHILREALRWSARMVIFLLIMQTAMFLLARVSALATVAFVGLVLAVFFLWGWYTSSRTAHE